ncbi:MAG TPA: 5-oxoprolinase subunit PxpB [Longimicrobiales bacterium]|nr:5-oxoprolinase subunit PxpB [Longimicrobiales bacterium]
MHIEPLGDHALLVHLGSSIDEETHRLVRAAYATLERLDLPGVSELVPAFTSIGVHYDPARVRHAPTEPPHEGLRRELAAALERLDPAELPPARTVEIPVCYGGDFGPDLADVAGQAGLSAREVVRRHAAGEYLVYMIGFAPGFPYLGGLDPRLATPRLDAPRTAVPAGSVGIGGEQTGIYPVESPGGWRLIGRTPLRLFDPTREPATLLRAGDRVRFRAVTAARFRELERGA